MIGRFYDDVNAPGTSAIKNSGLYKYGENPGGINILDEPNWNNMSPEDRDILNQEWLEAAFQRGDNIRLASNPAHADNIYNEGGVLLNMEKK